MKRLIFSRLIEERDGQSVSMRVLDATIEEWVNFGIPWLIDCMDAELNLAFVAVAHLCGGRLVRSGFTRQILIRVQNWKAVFCRWVGSNGS